MRYAEGNTAAFSAGSFVPPWLCLAGDGTLWCRDQSQGQRGKTMLIHEAAAITGLTINAIR